MPLIRRSSTDVDIDLIMLRKSISVPLPLLSRSIFDIWLLRSATTLEAMSLSLGFLKPSGSFIARSYCSKVFCSLSRNGSYVKSVAALNASSAFALRSMQTRQQAAYLCRCRRSWPALRRRFRQRSQPEIRRTDWRQASCRLSRLCRPRLRTWFWLHCLAL